MILILEIKNNFHLSQSRLSIYRNGVYYMGIKAFNHLPSYIKELSDDKIQFKNIILYQIPFIH
jgi:hypothetical protein